MNVFENKNMKSFKLKGFNTHKKWYWESSIPEFNTDDQLFHVIWIPVFFILEKLKSQFDWNSLLRFGCYW